MVREEEMDIREVAEMLGIPAGTVKSRLHYATKHVASQWRAIEDN
jgi:DNA-directed RNA polymerase specialized sigma24 family protein